MNAGGDSPELWWLCAASVAPPTGTAWSGGISRLGCPLTQNGAPVASVNPVYGLAGSGCSSAGRESPGARNVTVCTTRLLKTHFTVSPAWIVSLRPKNALRSRSFANFTLPASAGLGGGPPAKTVFVLAPAAGAAHAAPTVT